MKQKLLDRWRLMSEIGGMDGAECQVGKTEFGSRSRHTTKTVPTTVLPNDGAIGLVWLQPRRAMLIIPTPFLGVWFALVPKMWKIVTCCRWLVQWALVRANFLSSRSPFYGHTWFTRLILLVAVEPVLLACMFTRLLSPLHSFVFKILRHCKVVSNLHHCLKPGSLGCDTVL